jgi:uncharacterized protein
MPRVFFLALEFALVFVGAPLLIYFRVLPNFPIPSLLGIALVAYLLLRADPSFDRSHLSTWGNLHRFLAPLLLRDAFLLAALGVAVFLFAPGLLFNLIKRAPLFWALIMVAYPLLSVYPQELLYRAFFFHRYQPLFGSGWAMLFASALAFGFVHIIFGNRLAVALCVLGGFLFSYTYHVSGSLLLTCLEHAIFGNFIFTVGLGRFFYHGFRV